MFFLLVTIFLSLPFPIKPFSIDQGNWVKKREWLYEAKEDLMKMKNIEALLKQKESSYKERIAAMDNELNTFYLSIGMKKGEVAQILKQTESFIESKLYKAISTDDSQSNQGRSLNEREKEVQLFVLKKNLRAEKEEVAQLGIDMQSIWDHETRAKEIASLASQKIESIKNLVQNGEQLVQKIDQIKDHVEAARLRHQIQSLLKESEAIKGFVEGDAKNTLEQVISYVSQKSGSLEKSIAEARTKGIFIQEEAKELKEEQMKEETKPQEEEKATRKSEQTVSPSFIKKVLDFLISPFSWLLSFFSFSFSYKYSEEKSPEKQVISSSLNFGFYE